MYQHGGDVPSLKSRSVEILYKEKDRLERDEWPCGNFTHLQYAMSSQLHWGMRLFMLKGIFEI